MEINETSAQIINQNNNPVANIVDEKKPKSIVKNNSNTIVFQLGLWFLGLESFLKSHSQTTAEEDYFNHNWIKEFRLTQKTLLLCSKFTLEFLQKVQGEKIDTRVQEEVELLDSSQDGSEISNFSIAELSELSLILRKCVLLNEGFLRADKLTFNDWESWSRTLGEKLESVEVFQKIIQASEKESEKFLPEKLLNLLDGKQVDSFVETELKIILPKFAQILKYLSVVGKMLEDDRPLKPSLIIFSVLNWKMQEIIDYINKLLSRYPTEEDELFDSLDSAAYTASIELRKVYDQELKEIVGVRSAPLVYAKIENAYCLLNDSIQLTLVHFAQLIEPELEAAEVFPNLKVKEEQSIKLRENMWEVLQAVQEAEKNSETYPLDSLYEKLKNFNDDCTKFLFYKDIETLERFIEEILLIKDKKELVPILHRFGAYLETLLGQINMRAVLREHPFEPLQGTQNPQDMFA